MHMPATQALLQQKSRIAANMSSNAAEPLNTEESWSPQSAQVLDSLTYYNPKKFMILLQVH